MSWHEDIQEDEEFRRAILEKIAFAGFRLADIRSSNEFIFKRNKMILQLYYLTNPNVRREWTWVLTRAGYSSPVSENEDCPPDESDEFLDSLERLRDDHYANS